MNSTKLTKGITDLLFRHRLSFNKNTIRLFPSSIQHSTPHHSTPQHTTPQHLRIHISSLDPVQPKTNLKKLFLTNKQKTLPPIDLHIPPDKIDFVHP